jgi:hypothetical protein
MTQQPTSDELRELLSEATDGPWFAEVDENKSPDDVWLVYSSDQYTNDGDNLICETNVLGGDDASLIALAPTLAAEVLALRAENERLQKLKAFVLRWLNPREGVSDAERWDVLRNHPDFKTARTTKETET